MSSSTKNVKLGVCRVYYGGVDLGLTQGGVEVSVSTDTHPVEVDQFGKTPINEYIEGRKCQAKTPLAESTLRNMVAIMPGATLVSDGVQASATITPTFASLSGKSVTLDGVTFTYQAGNPTALGQVKVGANLAEACANLVEAISLHAGTMAKSVGGVKATTDGAIVTVRANDPGTGPNAITLVSGGAGIAVSGATLTGGVAETKARVDVTTGTGTDLLQIAQPLRLHPIANAEDNFADDFIIWRAATAGALTFAYKLDAERIYNTEFMGYPDPVTSKLYSVGSPLV